MLMAQRSAVMGSWTPAGSEALVIFSLVIRILVPRLVKGTLGQLS